jgi:hypothetical protein
MPQPHPSPAPRTADRADHWQPALAQLRTLSEGDLTAITSAWLQSLGVTPCHLDGRHGPTSTYRAFLGPTLLGGPLRLRIVQRSNRLQAHHVDAFAGWLTRCGIPTGILITTGKVTAEAREAAAAWRSPRVQLLSGPQWLGELAAHGIAVVRRPRPQWVVDLSASDAHVPPLTPANDTRW